MSHHNRSRSTVERDIERAERNRTLKNLEFLSDVDWDSVDIDVDLQELIENLESLSDLYSDDEKIMEYILEIQSNLPLFG